MCKRTARTHQNSQFAPIPESYAGLEFREGLKINLAKPRDYSHYTPLKISSSNGTAASWCVFQRRKEYQISSITVETVLGSWNARRPPNFRELRLSKSTRIDVALFVHRGAATLADSCLDEIETIDRSIDWWNKENRADTAFVNLDYARTLAETLVEAQKIFSLGENWGKTVTA